MTDRQIAVVLLLLAPVALPIVGFLFACIVGTKLVDFTVIAFSKPRA